MKTSNPYFFCFDLSFDIKLNCYLPCAYIVLKKGFKGYLDKKAVPEVLESFGIEIEKLDSNTKQLLAICETLKPNIIFKKFAAKSKSKTIEDLLLDKKIAFGISLFIKTKLQLFLELIEANDFPLCINLDKDKDFEKCKLHSQNSILETKLTFNKHSEGITYSLALKENEKAFFPSDHDVTLLLDEPAWLVIDKKIFRLKEINSNKLKPFLKKKSIEIPTETVAKFFDVFIKDIVKKVTIEAIGFRIETKNKIVSCALKPEHDFFRNSYYLDLVFDYDGAAFQSSTSRNKQVQIITSDEIYVIQHQRNKEEELFFENKMIELGFEKTETNLYKLQQSIHSNNPYEAIEYLIEHKTFFEEYGFCLDLLSIGNKKIQTNSGTITLTNEQKTDWFDLNLVIHFGKFEINFTLIIPNIKVNNRLFELQDGSYFLIPLEWMSKYEAILKFSTIKGNRLLLPKSNYTLLENLTTTAVLLVKPKAILYKPSLLLKATLRPYQEEGVKWLLGNYQNGLGSCLADDMGLGKTIQTLAMLVAVQEQLQFLKSEQEILTDLFGSPLAVAKEKMKILIVLPSSLVFNWYNESKKFAPHFSRLQYIGNNRKLLANKLDRYDLIFTSYSIVSRDISVFEKYHFRFLILDESQNIKNRKSETFKAINKINASNKISLSGTPIENSLSDLWSQMEFINPNILGSFPFFDANFKIPIEKRNDENCLLELKKIIQPFILRRKKEDVLQDLPEMTEQIYYCDMEPEQEKRYEEEKSKARNLLLKIDAPVDKLSTINTLMRLRQLSNHPKMIDTSSEIDSGKYIAVTNYLKTLVESNQKTIIFSSFLTNLEFYKTWCKENQINYCELIGSTLQKDREIEVNRFQEQEKPLLFFISLKAGGVGLNITRASHVLFLDPWWNPFSEKQGIGRAHRIGQLNKVNVVRFITKNTVEEKIIILQERKKLLSDSLLEDHYLNSEIIENLDYLLE